MQEATQIPGMSFPVPPVIASARDGNGHQPGADRATVAAAVSATTGDADPAPASATTGDGGTAPANEAPPGQPAAGRDTGVDPEVLVGALMEIVSERTGYPPEMLDPSLDLEADLGIDSIKRVEILNNFRKLLPESRQQQLEGGLEKLAGIKTLHGIIDWIRSDLNQASAPTGPQPSASPTQAAAADKPLQGFKSEVARGLIQLVALPAPTGQAALPDGTVIITDDGAGLSDALAESLAAREKKVVVVEHTGSSSPSAPKKRRSSRANANVPRYRADLASTEAVQQLVDDIGQEHGQPVGLVHLLALSEHGGKHWPDSGSAPPVVSPADSVYSLFLLLKSLAPVMPVKQADKKAFVIAATDLGGDFASSPDAAETFNPISAGVVGVVKSAAKEWPGVRTRVVDFARTASTADMARTLMDEMLSCDEHVEVGYKDGKRHGLEVVPAPLDYRHLSSQAAAPALDSSSVVLVTGGARGITAELCLELAQRYRPTFVILGRLPRPEGQEPRETAGLDSPRELKAAIMESLKLEGKPVSVQAVEAGYQQLLREREIRTNLEKLERAGSSVRYYAIDVRDPAAFGELIDRLYDTHGRVDGVIHGAGVIEDNLLQNKTLESFQRVFETKVSGALTLSRKLKLDTLKFFFLFSSVVGRTGNAGQTDYVAGNEVLNKLAVMLNRRSPARICSLMWGPWRGGMAQPELESIFASHGWAMIEPSLGRQSFIQELSGGAKGEAEVLLVGKPVLDRASSPERQETGAPAEPGADPGSFSAAACEPALTAVTKPRGAILHRATVSALLPGSAEFKVVLNTEDDLYLNDHTFDGIPVMPMAIALELMAEAAHAAYPDWQLARVGQLDIPAGIVFESGSKELTVVVEEQSATADGLKAQLSVVVEGTQRRTHFRCTADLTRGAPTSPLLPGGIPDSFALPAFLQPPAVLPKVRDIYENWLFHGPLFQGISTVDAMGSNGITGTLRVKGAAECLQDAGGHEWVVGPMLLDSAMQLAGVWARHYLDITVLPAGLKSLNRLSPVSGREFRAIVSIPKEIEHGEMRCDLAVYDERGTMVILVEGLAGIASKSFNRLASQPKALRTVR
jgi:NAD(P)-dependent dehydrogenase (short-subunit alcohol dehydrogenase family)